MSRNGNIVYMYFLKFKLKYGTSLRRFFIFRGKKWPSNLINYYKSREMLAKSQQAEPENINLNS